MLLSQKIYTNENVVVYIVMINQGTQSINDAIYYLTNHFILRHTNHTIYYPQGNGQTESINKVFNTLLTKLVNENQND
jgi:hypothetical protein